jgi:hypothetical protein
MIIGVALAGFAAFTPLSAQRPSGNQRGSGQTCTNSQRSGSVSDIIMGRRSASTVNCVDNRANSRANSRTNNQVNSGGWYQVGNDGYGGTIYERQTRDSNGNLIIQRARRDAYGNMSIISTQNAGNNGTYNNGGYNNGTYNNSTYNNRRNSNGDQDDQGNYQNGRGHDNGNHYGQNKSGKGQGKNKNKNHGDGD